MAESTGVLLARGAAVLDETSVAYRADLRSKEILTLTVTSAERAEPFFVEERQHPGLELSAARLERAISWLFDCDHQAAKAVAAGQSATKTIELRPEARSRVANTHEAALKQRSSAASLLLPLVLPPPSLNHLFPYQLEGRSWLLQRQAALLADDMGLGKTLQVISALQELARGKADPRFLIICPRSLLANWQAEFVKWAPELWVVRSTPAASHSEATWRALLGRTHVLVTSYEQLRDMPASLKDTVFGVVVADEAHRIRNAEAQVTKGFTTLKRDAFWALTGTPIERHPEDLLTLLSLMDQRRFSRRDAALAPAQIRSRARPYLLRRLKKDVQADLPPVVDNLQWLDLAPAQRRSYVTALGDARKYQHDQGRFLLLINKLREICDFDPETGQSAKIDRIVEIVDLARANEEKVVVFSYLLKPLALLQELLGKKIDRDAVCVLTGELSSEERTRVLGRFKSSPQVSALLASTRVGGEGLTLTEANHVVFLNEWWNPSSNAQARDRVMRIGQQKTVFVHRFRCKSTIEEALEGILHEKAEVFDQIVDALVDDGIPRLEGSLMQALKQKLWSEPIS